MSTSSSTYYLIAKILSHTYDTKLLYEELKNNKIDWDQLVIIGSQHLILPALYSDFKKKELLELLPQDLKDYLEEIHTINFNRNHSIYNQAQEISKLLQSNTIEPIFLKGVALLTSLHFDDFGYRMIGDIDVLVNSNQAQETFEILKTAGYIEGKGFNYKVHNYRHLTRLIHPEKIGAIEIHTDLLNPKHRSLLRAQDIFKHTQEKNDLIIPSYHYMILHSIYSQQLNNKGHYYFDLSFKIIADCINLQVYQNQKLLNELMQKKFGSSFLAHCNFFFDEFKDLEMNQTTLNYLNQLELYQKFPDFHRVKRFIQLNMLNIGSRIKLLLTNSSYRYHLWKNKIFPRFN